MNAAIPITQDLVMIGGGHTHAIVLRKWGMQPLAGVRLTLITNLVDTPYSGMLPCHISGLYDFDTAHIDLRPLSRFAHCQLVMDQAIGLDLVNQRVICAEHPPISYDLLSIDIGSTPATVDVPGSQDYAIPAKPVPNLLQAWHALLAEVSQQPTQPVVIGIVGGGVGGIELTLNMQVRLQSLLQSLGQAPHQVTFHLFHRQAELATGRNRWTRHHIHRLCQQRGIQVHLCEAVCAIEPMANAQRRVRCESGLAVLCDRIFWVTQAAAADWIHASGLQTDAAGFIQVNDALQSVSHPQVFAAGDIASMVNHPRPKAGVFAVRQGQPLFENLRRTLRGQACLPYHPQRQFLNIIDTGTGTAIASRGPFGFESRLARHWKDWIDRTFMRLFSDFPDRPMIIKPEAAVGTRSGDSTIPVMPTLPCAGCGSKVGNRVLSQALERVQAALPTHGLQREDILIGLHQPDDAAVIRIPNGQVLVQTVDYFRAMVTDPFLLGQICVNHCLSDIFAMGAVPQTALAIAVLPYATPAKHTETLYQLLSGVVKSLGQAQTVLIGGHTVEGADLALGLVCNGSADPNHLWRKSGMQVGNRLILTQSLGSGTLLAADMRFKAKGRWIEAAIAQMLHSNQAAAQCLQQHGATACTDVTGFGLIGHLLEMVQASRANVSLDLRTLPIYDGARETVAQGILSSLHPQNQALEQTIQNFRTLAHHPDYPLLFDPQTAGGLLASVPADQAAACIQALHHLGYTQSVDLGAVTAPQSHPNPILITHMPT